MTGPCRPRYIGTAEAARLLGCSYPTARAHMRACGGVEERLVCPECGRRSSSLLVERERFLAYVENRHAPRD